MALIIFQGSFVPQPVSMCTFGYLSIAATAMCEKDQFTPRERGGHGYRLVLNRDGPLCSYSPRAFSTTQALSPCSIQDQAFSVHEKPVPDAVRIFCGFHWQYCLPLSVPSIAWASCAAVGLGRMIIVHWSCM